MKTLIVCGSPKKGSSEKILEKLACALQQNENVDVATILLREKQLDYCTGCLLCEDEGICPIEDDMKDIAKYMLDSEYIIFITPVYFDNVPAILKNLIDRTNLLVSEMKEKKVFLITVGQADITSWNNCSDYIKNYCDIMNMQFLGSSNIYSRKVDDLTDELINEAIKGVLNNASN